MAPAKQRHVKLINQRQHPILFPVRGEKEDLRMRTKVVDGVAVSEEYTTTVPCFEQTMELPGTSKWLEGEPELIVPVEQFAEWMQIPAYAAMRDARDFIVDGTYEG